jgi:hypothetical protein
MSAQAHEPAPQAPPERTPKAVRAALSPPDRELFDAQFRAAMAEATEQLDLTPVWSCIDYWRHTVVLKASGEYERILARGEEISRLASLGEPLPGIPWDDDFDAQMRARLERG